ncbi:MAG: hypothetical protein HKO13_00670 [Sphingomonas sp.]|nr:hypothetical protein [Sphingomonas sp.]RZV52456.1 MAG: hypothetical protein EX258_02070 [Sphingomonadaceae bacterium]
MTQNDMMTGEERLKRKTRRKWAIMGVLFVIGLVVGFTAARMEDIRGYDFAGPWPPEIALGILAAFLVTISIGSWLQHREMDDYERDINRKAAAFAAMVILVGYPVWFLLWKAGMVIEPVHWMIFIGGYIALYAGLLFYRYR